MLQININKQYLWFPVNIGKTKKLFSVYCDDNKVFEFDQPCADEEPDFYAALNVEAFSGRMLCIKGEAPAGWFARIRQEAALPPPPKAIRPTLHFAADSGWLNDPNGLVYQDGIYHLYFQYNPFDVQWSNMHWGHAVSRDLFHWKQLDTVLCPDETGTMFSGSGIADDRNVAGYGKDALLFYYTAAGGAGKWSEGRPYRQMLAVSHDKGCHLNKTGFVAVDEIAEGTRDPKVFWHVASSAFVMVLFLEKNDFGIFRSADLLHWEMSQKLTLPDAWECPDLFELAVDGDAQDKKWVFWTADGFYFTGDFDGYRFSPQEPRRSAYLNALPYAAQTYSGLGERVVSVAWLRTKNEGLPFTGVMAAPAELALTRVGEEYRMRLPLTSELWSLPMNQTGIGFLPKGVCCIAELEDRAFLLRATIPQEAGSVRFTLPNGVLEIDFPARKLSFQSEVILFDASNELDFCLLADYGMVEIRAQRDTLYSVCETPVSPLSGPLTVQAEREIKVCQIDLFQFQHELADR